MGCRILWLLIIPKVKAKSLPRVVVSKLSKISMSGGGSSGAKAFPLQIPWKFSKISPFWDHFRHSAPCKHDVSPHPLKNKKKKKKSWTCRFQERGQSSDLCQFTCLKRDFFKDTTLLTDMKLKSLMYMHFLNRHMLKWTKYLKEECVAHPSHSSSKCVAL